jgi:hypothetical protein
MSISLRFLRCIWTHFAPNSTTSRTPQKSISYWGRCHGSSGGKTQKQEGAEFPRYLAEEFASSMATMGYIPPPFYSMRKIFYYEKNYPLYAIGLFSRHQLAYALWGQALKYSDDQLDLF